MNGGGVAVTKENHVGDFLSGLCSYGVTIGGMACICHLTPEPPPRSLSSSSTHGHHRSTHHRHRSMKTTSPDLHIEYIADHHIKNLIKYAHDGTDILNQRAVAAIPWTRISYHDCTHKCLLRLHVSPLPAINRSYVGYVPPMIIGTSSISGSGGSGASVISGNGSGNGNGNSVTSTGPIETNNQWVYRLPSDTFAQILHYVNVNDSLVMDYVCRDWYHGVRKHGIREDTFDDTRWFACNTKSSQKYDNDDNDEFTHVPWSSRQQMYHALITLFYRLYDRGVRASRIRRLLLHFTNGSHVRHLIEQFPSLHELHLEYYNDEDYIDLSLLLEHPLPQLRSLVIHSDTSMNFTTAATLPSLQVLKCRDTCPSGLHLLTSLTHLEIRCTTYRWFVQDISSWSLPHLKELLLDLGVARVKMMANTIQWCSNQLERLEVQSIEPDALMYILHAASSTIRHLRFRIQTAPVAANADISNKTLSTIEINDSKKQVPMLVLDLHTHSFDDYDKYGWAAVTAPLLSPSYAVLRDVLPQLYSLEIRVSPPAMRYMDGRYTDGHQCHDQRLYDPLFSMLSTAVELRSLIVRCNIRVYEDARYGGLMYDDACIDVPSIASSLTTLTKLTSLKYPTTLRLPHYGLSVTPYTQPSSVHWELLRRALSLS